MVGDGDKLERLRKLKERMEKQFERRHPRTPLWFFEDGEKRVDGYLGTEAVMFVGQRPTRGESALAPKLLGGFYDLVKEFGFARAHVTDLVKEVGPAGTPSSQQVGRNWPFFTEELEIVEPKVVVALGTWVFDALEQRIERLVPVRRFPHYANRFKSQEKVQAELRAHFERLRRTLEAPNTRCCR